jgi:hypothetical protein
MMKKPAKAKARRYIAQETGHGREEARSYTQMPVHETLRGCCCGWGENSLLKVVMGARV